MQFVEQLHVMLTGDIIAVLIKIELYRTQDEDVFVQYACY
jgi:hypothetical protein